MKKLLVGILIFVLFFSGKSFAQDISAVGSNLLRIGSGETFSNTGESERKRYLEEIANARIFFNNLTLGFRYEMDDPSEVGRSFQGIRRRWIEYKKDYLNLQAGDVYALYGRGLTLNAFESRPLNYDSWLDGVSGNYEYNWSKEESDLRPSLGAKLIAGTLLFHNVVDTTLPDELISARAINGQFGLFGKKLTLGLTFLQAFTSISEPGAFGDVKTLREVNQPELYLGVISGDVAGFFQFAEMRSVLSQVHDRPDSASHRGKAIYGSLSYAGSDLGLTFEYKNYSYNIQRPGAENASYFSKLPISNPPEVYKEFTYASLTRTTHTVNFDDELGFQLEANITAIEGNTITLYGAASSRHNSPSSERDSNFVPLWAESTSLVPKFSGNGFYPFWEAFLEFEHDFGELNYFKVFAHRRSDVIAYSISAGADVKLSTTFGAKVQYQTTPSQSLLSSFEVQFMHDDARILNDHKLMNVYFLAQYSFNPIITFGGVFDFSTWYEDSRHIWPQGFISYRIGAANNLLLSYGAERKGLNCTGGICRLVPEFEGVRLTLTSQL
ncbi:MAG TPA: DUF6029 family protein [Candidatus Kapabacteria bacterium]|nr:DUF6029 family protein [Candidatus Kapabacteria bacterium]